LRFKRRVIEPEWLDATAPDASRNSLADLIRLNRRWGGYSSLRRLLSHVPTNEEFTVLDVGAASGDMGREIRLLRPAARVVSLDYTPHHLDPAPAPKLVADAFRLPFAPASFDYVFSSLFLHHFTDEQVVALLAGFGNVARRGVLVVDLERRAIPYYFVPATRAVLGWDPITVHDAPISVAAGFRGEELRHLALRAGLRNPVVRAHGFAFRVTLFGESGSTGVEAR
jgi:SAM-dependent methyltransferase